MNSSFHLKSKWYHKMKAVLFFTVLVLGVILFTPLDILYHVITRKQWHQFTKPAVWFFKPIFKLFRIQITVIGQENIPSDSGFVIISNHQSFIDIGVIWRSVGPSAFLAKRDLWKIPGFGKILDLTGSIPVDRKKHRENLKIGKRMKNLLNQKYNFCVFPEGLRSKNGKVLPFKNGIFKMAKEQKMILLPVTLVDTGRRLASKEIALHSGKIKVLIHPPVFPEQYETHSMSDLRNKIQKIIETPLETLSEVKGD